MGPALITACVVFGPGSLLISSKVGANYGYDLLWLLLLTGVLMGTYMTMASRIGVCGGATPCQLIARRAGRWLAVLVGLNLCLICSAFQFSNNIAFAAAADNLGVARIFGDPATMTERTRSLVNSGVLLVFNAAVIAFIFALKQVYRVLERVMKIMVAVILVSFLVNLLVVQPQPFDVLKGLIPAPLPPSEDRFLFALDPAYANDLAAGAASPRLRDQFAAHGRRLSPEARIDRDQTSGHWVIGDMGKTYTVRKQGDELLVHKGRLLLSTTTEFEHDLDQGRIPPPLRGAFANRQIDLSSEATATVDEAGRRWLIGDGTDPKSNEQYTVTREGDSLSVYQGVTFIVPMILIGALLGTTFSVGGAYFQGNLVRERGWTLKDYNSGFRDAVAGVCVLTGVSAMIMITSGAVLRDAPASNIGVLATQLRPLLGPTAHVLFCIGLLAVAMNPFVINAMIGGSILADGIGKAPRLSDPWPRRFTVLVLLFGMGVAMLVLHTPINKVDAIIFGQALTVIGNPLMAAVLLWLANRRDVMGDRRNGIITNALGGLGLIVVILMAGRVLYSLVQRLS